ncbi:MAG TPA: hypothetical protein VGP22_16295 [Albitalea sp.]|jgi:hypothetical protein|nr:hypothetical protein [Albitalea sp.]
MKRGRALFAWTVAAVVLVSVFAAYLRPDLAVTLANQLWNCF